MSLNSVSTVDELLADGLVQSVMRADHVEPGELKTMLNGVAARIAHGRQNERKGLRFFAAPRLERRPDAGGANALTRALPAPLAELCAAGLCC
jgi:hypothetical protein